MNKYMKAGGILIVFLALAALIGSSLTFAQDEPDTPDTPDVTIPEGEGFAFRDRGGHGRPHGPLDRGLRGAAFQEALAAELGITVEQLASAQDAAKMVVLEQMVADGTITQEQLDNLLAAQELRELAGTIFSREDAQEVIADTLGISVSELETAQEEGTRLSELADEYGVTVDEIVSAVSAARSAAFEEAVADGTLTIEQAEQLQSRPERPRPHGHGHGRPFGPDSEFTPGFELAPEA